MVNNKLDTEPTKLVIFPDTKVSECGGAASWVDTDDGVGFCTACEMWVPYLEKENECNA